MFREPDETEVRSRASIVKSWKVDCLIFYCFFPLLTAILTGCHTRRGCRVWTAKGFTKRGKSMRKTAESLQLAKMEDAMCSNTRLQIACTSRLPSVANQLEIYAPAVLLLTL